MHFLLLLLLFKHMCVILGMCFASFLAVPDRWSSRALARREKAGEGCFWLLESFERSSACSPSSGGPSLAMHRKELKLRTRWWCEQEQVQR